jgi:hypothetical protein
MEQRRYQKVLVNRRLIAELAKNLQAVGLFIRLHLQEQLNLRWRKRLARQYQVFMGWRGCQG